MNNYPNFKNFNYSDLYNNMNNVLNNPYENIFKNINNEQKNNKVTSLYDPYNGFIRGNLFKNLYDPYKQGEPYEIKPANEQARLLTEIDALGFSMVDLNLLLDVDPDNREAIKLFNQYREQKENLTKQYESKYGPITTDSDNLNSYPWAWDNMPWPWDN